MNQERTPTQQLETVAPKASRFFRRVPYDLFIAWVLGFLACAAFLGCGDNMAPGPDYRPQPNQEQAIDLVWYGVYGKNFEPPLIDWVHGDRLDCPGGISFSINGVCAFGYFDPSVFEVAVAVAPSGLLSDGSLAHELCHAKAWAETGNLDPDHVGPCFNLPEYLAAAGQSVLLGAGI